MISMLAMAAMVSCTNEIETLDQPINSEKVEIELNAGIIPTTKAAVPSKLASDLPVLFLRATDASNADWATTPTTVKAIISKESGNPISFKESDGTTDKKLYYPTGGSQAHLAGYYLGDATPTGDANVLKFTIDGTQDIMATEGQSASNTEVFKTFNFQHLLSQVEIKLVGEKAAQNAFGKITKVDIVSPTDLQLTLSSSAPALTTDGANANNVINVYKATDAGAGTELTNTATTIGNTVMIYNGGTPAFGTTGNELKLKITSANAGEVEVPVTITTDGLQASHSHVITLTFKDRITANATIGTWDAGTAGTGEVE